MYVKGIQHDLVRGTNMNFQNFEWQTLQALGVQQGERESSREREDNTLKQYIRMSYFHEMRCTTGHTHSIEQCPSLQTDRHRDRQGDGRGRRGADWQTAALK
jgi:hypothetical protein